MVLLHWPAVMNTELSMKIQSLKLPAYVCNVWQLGSNPSCQATNYVPVAEHAGVGPNELLAAIDVVWL